MFYFAGGHNSNETEIKLFKRRRKACKTVLAFAEGR